MITMNKKIKASGFPFQDHEEASTNCARIVRQNEETLIIEEDNTIYEIDKKCAIARGWMH